MAKELDNNSKKLEKKVQNPKEKLEKQKKSVLSQIWKTLDDTGKDVVKFKKEEITAPERQALSQLKKATEGMKSIKVKENHSRYKVKINLKKYDRAIDLDRLYKDFSKTDSAEYLQDVHDQLRERNIGAHYLHLLEQEDNGLFS